MLTIAVTGKLVEYIVDNYVIGSQSKVGLSDLPKGGEQNYKIGLLKGEEFSSAFDKISLYKSENSLADELDNLK